MDNDLGTAHLAGSSIPELEIRAITNTDRQVWEPLWRGYLTFYEKTLAPEVTEFTWNRLTAGHDIHGLLAERSGEVLGLVHFLLHPSTSNVGGNCYLQDLFVVPEARGSRVGQRLIAAVAQESRKQGPTESSTARPAGFTSGWRRDRLLCAIKLSCERIQQKRAGRQYAGN